VRVAGRGRDGQCWGITTPSVTGVEVVGGSVGDLAFNVHFDHEAIADAWFRPDLVEYLDHVPGTDATVGDTHSFARPAESGARSGRTALRDQRRRHSLLGSGAFSAAKAAQSDADSRAEANSGEALPPSPRSNVMPARSATAEQAGIEVPEFDLSRPSMGEPSP
jgi:hypothetical protein